MDKQLKFEAILRQLGEKGIKITPQRLEIIKALQGAPSPLTAREVANKVRLSQPRVSLDTVYRNLTLLTETGLVNQINLQNRESTRFEFQGEADHHHHYVCLQCGVSFCVEACPLPILPQLDEDPDFKVVNHAFEVYGFCSECQRFAPMDNQSGSSARSIDKK